MQKFGDVEKIEVLRGNEASVLNDHMRRLGKYKVSDFNKSEKEDLQQDLQALRDDEDEADKSTGD